MNINSKKWNHLPTILIISVLGLVLPIYAVAAVTLQKVSYQPNQAAGQLTLQFSKALTVTPSSFLMENRNQLVFDFKDVSNLPKSSPNYSGGVVDNVDFIQAHTRLRMIVSLTTDVDYTSALSADKKSFTLKFTRHIVKASKPTSVSGSNNTAQAKVTGIDFKPGKSKDSGRIIVSLSKKTKTNIIDRGDTIHVVFKNTRTTLLKTYNAQDFGTPVQNFSLIYNAIKNETLLKINNKGIYAQTAYQSGNQFIIDVESQEKQLTAHGETKYKGERISLNFQDISVRAVLQLLSDFTGMNMIVSDSVGGNVTLRLQHVPWDQALDFILRSQGLAKRTMGNIMIVGPAAEIAAQEQAELKAKQDLEALAPLYTETFTINYGDAKNYVALLNAPENSLLSPRGRAVMLASSNQIIVEDTAGKLKAIRELFRQADLPAKQVQIEARIVYVRKGFERDLGVAWKVNNSDNNAYFRDFSMDLKASPVGGGTVPVLELGKILAGHDIDLKLSALESIAKADIVSSPRLLTSNNQAAMIEQGTQIPYTTQSPSGGTTVELVPAVLKLSVTPQITPNNKLLLEIEINQDRPVQSADNSAPSIDTRKIVTNILIDNGETVVLGGVYETDKQKVVTRIPLLGAIPVLGYLFRKTQVIDNKSELLIFLTPKIIETNDE